MAARIPALDLGGCTRCDSCVALCPEVFRLNPETHMIEVVDLPVYPKERVDEVIVMCPASCISWGER
jgi:ferredoxin